MAASTSFIRQYRCAVYLNNAATTFMARGDYLEACIGSREALTLIESLVRPCESPDSTTQENNDSVTLQQSFDGVDLDLSKIIQHVDKRLASIHTKTTTPVVPVEILYYDGSLGSRGQLLEQQKNHSCTSKNVAMPIRISGVIVDEIDDVDELLLNVTEIVPSIMLLNYAISHLCYYKCTNSQTALDGTLRLFQMSMKVLCIHDRLPMSSSIDNDNFANFTEGRLFVAIALLLNIKGILVESENVCLPVVQCDCGQIAPPGPLSQPTNVSLSLEMIQDLEALQTISNEWVVYSRLYISALYRTPNAGAA